MLKDDIRKEFIESRKAKNLIKKNALEAIIALILQKEKIEKGTEVDDKDVIQCLEKEIKVQKEINNMYLDRDSEKANEAQQKIEILSEYLPKQLTEEEVLSIIKELDVFEDNSNKTKGMIMKSLMPKITGKFDKSKINGIVVNYLQNK